MEKMTWAQALEVTQNMSYCGVLIPSPLIVTRDRQPDPTAPATIFCGEKVKLGIEPDLCYRADHTLPCPLIETIAAKIVSPS